MHVWAAAETQRFSVLHFHITSGDVPSVWVFSQPPYCSDVTLLTKSTQDFSEGGSSDRFGSSVEIWECEKWVDQLYVVREGGRERGTSAVVRTEDTSCGDNKTGTSRQREDVVPLSWRSDKTLRTCWLSSTPVFIALCYLPASLKG